ncbi:MAG: PDZ domain-containing protein [Planctomycetota bacterium]
MNRWPLIVLLLAPLAGIAAADPPVAVLAAEDFETRQAATDELLRDETLTPEDLAAMATRAEHLEARLRLWAVARHHALRELRAARFPAAPDGRGSIGIVQSVEPITPEPADGPRSFALVNRVLPGFPANGRLRPLDHITAVGGEPLLGPPERQRFEQLMRETRAGQELTLTVQRGEQTLEVTLTLAAAEALPAMYAFPEFGLTPEYAAAWDELAAERYPALRAAAAIGAAVNK